MNYVKPQKPLIQDGKGIYPITTIDQVVRADGRRFSENEFNRVFQRNLLRPTLQTTTVNGVTCTNNGDGTYTLNGTAAGDASVTIGTISLPSGNYKLVGCPSGGSTETFNLRIGKTQSSAYYGNEVGSGLNLIGNEYYTININAVNGFTCNNLVFKPMLTEDLNATYDDFVSFDDSVITGINSGVKMDLLWANASPTSAFFPQTISLDLSSYKSVMILGKVEIAFSEIQIIGNFPINTNNYRILAFHSFITCRNINFNNGIVFSDACTFTNYTVGEPSVSTNNTYCIPTHIYGIK